LTARGGAGDEETWLSMVRRFPDQRRFRDSLWRIEPVQLWSSYFR
jgi:hypothetical protein